MKSAFCVTGPGTRVVAREVVDQGSGMVEAGVNVAAWEDVAVEGGMIELGGGVLD